MPLKKKTKKTKQKKPDIAIFYFPPEFSPDLNNIWIELSTI